MILDVDYLLIAAALFLLAVGIFTIAGATLDDPRPAVASLWKKQLIFALVALGVGAAAVVVDYRWLIKYAYVFYALSLLLLLALYLPAIGHSAKGARSWLELPFVNYRFQPSEAVKFALILALAKHLSGLGSGDPSHPQRFASLLSTLPALALTAVPAFLILIQPDLGSAVILPLVVLGMLYAAGCPAGRLFLLCAPALAALPPMLWRLEETLSGPACFFIFCRFPDPRHSLNLRLRTRPAEIAVLAGLAVAGFWIVSEHFEDAWNHLHPYQQDRILAYLYPEGQPERPGLAGAPEQDRHRLWGLSARAGGRARRINSASWPRSTPTSSSRCSPKSRVSSAVWPCFWDSR
ncbi:FtsW/RodA/SpoVE family cell cycle protein [bacterium]|nr:FtsW/RodA/SpoVE family cell cycle protein [bacterium]